MSKFFKKHDQEKVKTTNLLIIDASGSMQSKKEEVRGGIKEILKTIKEDAEKDKDTVDTRTIVIDFSGPTDIRVLLDEADSTKINDTISEGYNVRGMTALYDAMAVGFAMVQGDKCFVNILTDGDENASQKCSYSQIKELLQGKKSAGWGIIFMGTTEQSIQRAEGMGISKGNTMAFADNARGVKMSMGKTLNARASYHASNTAFASKGAEGASLSRGIDLDNMITNDEQNEKLVKQIKEIKPDKKK